MPEKQFFDDADRVNKIKLAESIWLGSDNLMDCPARFYLEYVRGISSYLSEEVRTNSRVYNSFTNKYHSAVIAKVTDLSGNFTGIHRIYVGEDCNLISPKKHSKLSLGSIKGNCIKLNEYKGKIIACEGLEDGLTILSEISESDLDYSVWVATGGNLANLNLPNNLEELIIAIDNDGAGNLLAKNLASKIRNISIKIAKPPEGLKDFNEIYTNQIRGH